jgi:predicted HTH domain antitoxin
MTSITLDFPSDVFAALRRSPDEFARELRMAAAIHWYSQALISQEKAAEVAGVHRIEFLDELARRHVEVVQVDPDDLARELSRG